MKPRPFADPRPRLRIDIETYSPEDLPKVGVYRYAAHPDFLILFAWWSLDGGPLQLAETRAEIEAIPGLLDPKVLKVAQNAAFERVCFSAFFGLPTGEYLDPADWHDTQAVAGELGYPQKLGNLAIALGASPKDEAGTLLINRFCKPNRKGQRNLPADFPALWLDFVDYGEQDVVTLIEVDEALGDFPTEMERQVYLADQAANDRGIRIDAKLARASVAAGTLNQGRQKLELIELTDWSVENPASQPQMMRWVEAEGLPATNLRAETVERLLSGDLTPVQRRVLELRQDLALVAPKKFASALKAMLPDERLRGTLKFFGAHTGRWAGRGTQVQNLPREQLGLSPDEQLWLDAQGAALPAWPPAKREAWKLAREAEIVEAAIMDLLLGLGADSTTLKALVRAMFTGPFTVVDYAAIEARVIAWVAREQWAIDAFRAGRDIYVETAERMGGLSRSEGKVAVLALGYAGGVNSLRALGGDELDARSDDELWLLVRQWRNANPRIVRLWSDLGDAFGDTGKVGPLTVSQSYDSMGRAVHIELPSGRAISYHNVKWEKYAVPDPKRPGRFIRKEGWRYADPKNPFNTKMRIGTYGGRLAENVTQAIARDLLAEALVRLEAGGYPVVAHVHDEAIVEGEHSVETISRIMCEVPAWARGLPVDGEGFTCKRYRKG